MRMRRSSRLRIWFVVVTVLTATLVLASCGGGQAPPAGGGTGEQQDAGAGNQDQGQQSDQAQETIRLKVADSFPPSHWMPTRGTRPWMERVTELTNGRVQFDYYPSEQLGKLSDMLNLLKSGVTDIAYLAPTSLSGELPLSGVAFLPGAFTTAVDGSKAYASLLKEGPVLDEYTKQGVRPLFAVLLPGYDIFSVKKPVAKLEDLKGLKVRSAGSTQDAVVQALGAVPVSIPTPEVYTALQRGTVDASVFPYPSVKDYKVDELIKHATYGSGITSFAVVYAISNATWDKLPQDVKDAMQQAADEVIPGVIQSLDEDTQKLASEFESKGIKIYRLSDDERARWQQVLAPVWDQWVKDMEAKGLPGQQVREAFEQALGRK